MSNNSDHSPLVSIAIISYNQRDFLRECIDSCLSQTYNNIEIVVADDGSTDGTHELLIDYSRKYRNKFKLSLSVVNRGISKNSNAAHSICTGKYIAWMGADDLMLPEKIERQVAFMESRPDCAITYHNLIVFEATTGRTIRYFNEKQSSRINGDIKSLIRKGTFNGACSTMVRRLEAPEDGFDELIPVASDWLYWIDTLANGGSICYIDEVLGKYRRHSSNVTAETSDIRRNELDHLLTCQILISKYPEHFADIMAGYSSKILALRGKVSYFQAIKVSFLLAPSFKGAIRILAYLLSFTRCRL